MEIRGQVEQKFQLSVQCRGCGSRNVEIDFYPGAGFDSDPGWLQFECRDCGFHMNIDYFER
jgi:hypothetical protein